MSVIFDMSISLNLEYVKFIHFHYTGNISHLHVLFPCNPIFILLTIEATINKAEIKNTK